MPWPCNHQPPRGVALNASGAKTQNDARIVRTVFCRDVRIIFYSVATLGLHETSNCVKIIVERGPSTLVPGVFYFVADLQNPRLPPTHFIAADVTSEGP